MIFTQELKNEVFGTTSKNTTLAHAKVVDRAKLQVQAPQALKENTVFQHNPKPKA